MKVALAQLNTKVGDISENTKRILGFIHKAELAGADLAVFPELAIIGYPPRDLLDYSSVTDKNLEALAHIAQASKKITVVIGCAEKNPDTIGKPLYNAAAILRNGKVELMYHKQLLPSYDVFEEERHFEPGHSTVTFVLGGKKIGITICEDVWNFPGFLPRSYASEPLKGLAESKIDLLLNISASPFHLL